MEIKILEKNWYKSSILEYLNFVLFQKATLFQEQQFPSELDYPSRWLQVERELINF